MPINVSIHTYVSSVYKTSQYMVTVSWWQPAPISLCISHTRGFFVWLVCSPQRLQSRGSLPVSVSRVSRLQVWATVPSSSKAGVSSSAALVPSHVPHSGHAFAQPVSALCRQLSTGCTWHSRRSSASSDLQSKEEEWRPASTMGATNTRRRLGQLWSGREEFGKDPKKLKLKGGKSIWQVSSWGKSHLQSKKLAGEMAQWVEALATMPVESSLQVLHGGRKEQPPLGPLSSACALCT